MRINKYLASCGIASRRKVEELVLQGKVKVNGVVVTNLATNIEEADVVELDGKVVALQQNYVMLHAARIPVRWSIAVWMCIQALKSSTRVHSPKAPTT